jgi:hypothetical protein
LLLPGSLRYRGGVAEDPDGIRLLVSIGAWLVYFSIIFFPLRWAYDRLVEAPLPSRRERLNAWSRRRTRLRRGFVAAGIASRYCPCW